MEQIRNDIVETDGILVMPNEQELDMVKRLGYSNRYKSPVAVWNRKVARKELNAYKSAGATEKQVIPGAREAYPNYKFLYHLQVAQGVVLQPEHLNTADSAQDVKENPYFLIYQRGADVSETEFTTRLDSAAETYKHKILVPVLDVATRDLALLQRMCEHIGARGYKTAAVLFRNTKKYSPQWQVISSILGALEVTWVCIGIQRRWVTEKNGAKVRKIATLAAPLPLGCKGVAHYRPWSGGPSEVTLLTDQMLYEAASKASSGVAKFNGADRLDMLKNMRKPTEKYELSRVDAILEAEDIIKKEQPLLTLPLIGQASSRIEAIRYFAEQFGIL